MIALINIVRAQHVQFPDTMATRAITAFNKIFVHKTTQYVTNKKQKTRNYKAESPLIGRVVIRPTANREAA